MISPTQRFTKIITAPRTINQKIPARNPDWAKMYGRPRIPAPIIVPVSVKVAAQNFLFIFSSPVFYFANIRRLDPIRLQIERTRLCRLLEHLGILFLECF